MSVKLERLEAPNMAKLTIEVSAQEFEEALEQAYQKQRKDISMPGFRKGKVPRVMIEKSYGPAVFYEEAYNILVPTAYAEALKEIDEEVVSRPTIDIDQMEKGKPFIITAEVALKPDVELGKYVGVAAMEIDTAVNDDEVDDKIREEMDQNARLVTIEGRPVQEGDTAVIDFEGFIDGEAFEGGKGENYSLEIGSGTFIPGFEEQLIGANAGDEIDVNVTFPEDYHVSTGLAGKAALFKVKLHEIKEAEKPEMDDEFAQDVSEFDTLDEYKADIRRQIEEQKKQDAKQAQMTELIEKVIEEAAIDIPESMIDLRVEDMMNQFTLQLAQGGMELEQYMRYTGNTVEDFKAQMRVNAQKGVASDLVLEKIALVEGFEITDEELDAEIARMAEQYQLGLEQLKDYMGEDEKKAMMRDLASKKAADYIFEHAVFVPAPAAEDDEEAADDGQTSSEE